MKTFSFALTSTNILRNQFGRMEVVNNGDLIVRGKAFYDAAAEERISYIVTKLLTNKQDILPHLIDALGSIENIDWINGPVQNHVKYIFDEDTD